MTKQTNDLKGSRRGGFYFKDGRPYASVTTILHETIKNPALEYWQMKQVYLAMFKDPTISQKDAMAAPSLSSGPAANRGTTVHDLVEAYDNNPEVKTTEEYEGYLQAYREFKKEMQVEVIRNEQSLFSEKYGYAGTLDKIVRLKEHKNLVLVDVKTSKDIYDDFYLQLSAYKNMVIENGLKKEIDIAVLRLDAKGRYYFAYGDYDFDAFLAVKKVWEWKHRNKLKEIGYLGGDEKNDQ